MKKQDAENLGAAVGDFVEGWLRGECYDEPDIEMYASEARQLITEMFGTEPTVMSAEEWGDEDRDPRGQGE